MYQDEWISHQLETKDLRSSFDLTKRASIELLTKKRNSNQKASKMNMNNLLNEDNDGYAWEGDYEQTW